MFKSFRMIVCLCLGGGVSLVTVIGLAAGLADPADPAASFLRGLREGFSAWVGSLGWADILTGAGVLATPLVVLVVILAITDS